MRKIKVAGVGCCLLDRIYDDVDFTSDAFHRYSSRQSGDGGLEPGKLTFEEELERFCGRPFCDVLPELTGGRPPVKENVGGPCIVALIHAAQMAFAESQVSLYGCRGDDTVGRQLLQRLQRTPIDLSHYRVEEGGETASTVVLSDPRHDGGHGERTFVNTIGAAWHYLPQEVDDSFFGADICVFGGTALVPAINDNLADLLRKARAQGSLTVVNTVYDSLSEKAKPSVRWPLGSGDDCYFLTDLLITDNEEALRLSGQPTTTDAIAMFRDHGARAVIVTNGAHDVQLWADSARLGHVDLTAMPVSQAVGEVLRYGVQGDSTGCGDNFAGGVIASLAQQLYHGATMLDLREACRWGIVSGGITCFYYGGTYEERQPGEKLQKLLPYYQRYREQEN